MDESMTLQKALEILRIHNTKGTPVLRITANRYYEQDLLKLVLDGCETLLEQNAEAKRVLQLALTDFKIIGEIQAMPTPMLHTEYGIHITDLTTHEWRYASIAKKLIEGEIDGTGPTSVRL